MFLCIQAYTIHLRLCQAKHSSSIQYAAHFEGSYLYVIRKNLWFFKDYKRRVNFFFRTVDMFNLLASVVNFIVEKLTNLQGRPYFILLMRYLKMRHLLLWWTISVCDMYFFRVNIYKCILYSYVCFGSIFFIGCGGCVSKAVPTMLWRGYTALHWVQSQSAPCRCVRL